jgi:UDP-N-acetylmuramoyl-L-alanyl-D-glutamate--2,6-diaminopimelate ligase
MKLNHLLKGVRPVTIKGERYLDIENISYNSKQLKHSGLFFAIEGKNCNGYDFIDEAIERGAVSIAAEKDFVTYKSITKVIVEDIRKACALIAANFYSHPSQRVETAGITGTNGKTTTLYLIAAIMRYSGCNCGMIGTINYRIGERLIPAVNTTPSPIMLQMFLREMEMSGITNCVMEVSSHALDQNRVDAIEFNKAIFTNLTSEHLDYHKDMKEYFNAKSKLFSMLKQGAVAIINSDDNYGRLLIREHKNRVLTYGINNKSDVKAFDIDISCKGASFKVETPKQVFDIKTDLIGVYNIYNILAAISFAYSTGLKPSDIQEAIRGFKGVPGRLQRVEACGNKGFSVFIDYAHTDDALLNVLSALKEIAKGVIIVVFGCGGDRDRKKRPGMAKVAAEFADYVVITSDNPRSEDPERIIDDVAQGLPKDFKNYRICIDRKKAIEYAISMVKSNDMILIAGKGHESYQVFKDTTIPFDDKKVAEEILEQNKV